MKYFGKQEKTYRQEESQKPGEGLGRQERGPVKGGRERCVCCGRGLDIPVDREISLRPFYIEGAGQLCYDCFQELYGSRERGRGREDIYDKGGTSVRCFKSPGVRAAAAGWVLLQPKSRPGNPGGS